MTARRFCGSRTPGPVATSGSWKLLPSIPIAAPSMPSRTISSLTAVARRSDKYNQALSIRRAQSVKDEMVRQGIGGDEIAIEGKSFHDPMVPTGPNVREPKNRRAVIDLGG